MEESQINRHSLIVRAFCALIRIYQWPSSFWGPRCRFYPSCSAYMSEALQQFGFWKGLGCGCVRIFKCHPFHPGGVDFVRAENGK